LEVADELTDPLLAAGYVRTAITQDVAKSDARSTVAQFDHSDDEARWQKRLFGSADPGRPTNVHVRVDGSPGQQFALLFVDWAKANPAVQSEYLDLKRRVATQEHPTTGAYADAKEPWFVDAYRRAWQWADSTGWRP
jgi:dephospho-CoA kinase